ncbi:1624_t:CDS:2 [Dentiscutata heterogama]|uniref:1624_t:CDS:1 n=1 Tax=Dentiscutata heterogama TaxID=1316150 RepID=A0ACA9KBN4_9GLOM|nr:1624_t:CDS:2 [Dentiscutata heterogama]
MDTNNLYKTEISDTSSSTNQDISDNNAVASTATTSSNTNTSIILNKKKTRPKISDVRSYFKQKTINDKEVVCNFCKTPFSKTTATGTLHKHLNSQHLGWNMNKLESKQQLFIFIPETTILRQTLTLAQKTHFNMLITEWIILNTLPFSIVSSKSFAKMLQYLNINIDLPLRETIKSTIQKTFIIDNKWKLKKILLDICMLPHPHTGSNVILAMQLLKGNLALKNNFHFYSRHCLAYILNLIVTASLLPIKSLIKKVYNFVNIILSSSSITQDFKELEQSIGKGKAIRKILQDVSTQWNSTYMMLSAYVTIPTTIAAIIRRNKKLNKFKLTLQEEANLQATTKFLEPFYETTNVLSSSTYITLGISILLIDDIIDNISSCIHDSTSPEFLKEAATQMFGKIQKYTNEIYDKTAFIAAILDPRIKLELISDDMNTEANCSIFNNIFRTEYSNLILNSLSTNLEVPLNLIYTEQVAQKKRKTNTPANKPDEFT